MFISIFRNGFALLRSQGWVGGGFEGVGSICQQSVGKGGGIPWRDCQPTAETTNPPKQKLTLKGE